MRTLHISHPTSLTAPSLLSGQPTPAILQQSHPQTPQLPYPSSPFPPITPQSNSKMPIEPSPRADSPEAPQQPKKKGLMRDRSISTPNVLYNSTAAEKEGSNSEVG